jgi:hemerythrin
MALIKWTAEYELGVASIDAQHKHLVDIVNRFDESLQKGKGSRVMNEILNELVGYTQEHFADEEKIMSQAGYEHLKQHQAQHRQLLQKVERFQFEFNGEGRRVTSDVQDFLRYWLSSHILKDDKAFVRSRQQEPVES